MGDFFFNALTFASGGFKSFETSGLSAFPVSKGNNFGASGGEHPDTFLRRELFSTLPPSKKGTKKIITGDLSRPQATRVMPLEISCLNYGPSPVSHFAPRDFPLRGVPEVRKGQKPILKAGCHFGKRSIPRSHGYPITPAGKHCKFDPTQRAFEA